MSKSKLEVILALIEEIVDSLGPHPMGPHHMEMTLEFDAASEKFALTLDSVWPFFQRIGIKYKYPPNAKKEERELTMIYVDDDGRPFIRIMMGSRFADVFLLPSKR